VIAITGSLGKTTTKECLASALQAYGNTLKTLNNHNDQCGVPHSIRAMRP
jgi:UDP-N-acetylmuramoyl-tripeptide--D-alanyl-D-alanine ligase